MGGVEHEPVGGGLRASLSLLRRNRDFRRLYVASLISLGGDWFLLVALFILVGSVTRSPILVALVLAVQEFTYLVASPAAGHLVDRFDRRKIMITADVGRGLLCLGFLLVRSGSEVWLIFVLLVLMSSLSSAFEPASQAALPNLVDREDLSTANALSGSLWGTMLVIGAAVGGLVTAAFGRDASIVIDAGSFACSAALIAGIHRHLSEARESGRLDVIRATREGIRYARGDPDVLALLSAKVGWGLAAGVIVLLPLLATGPYASGALGLGLLMAARGLGAIIGPFVGRSWLGVRDRRIFIEIGLALAVLGVGYVLLGVVPSLVLALPILVLAQMGGGTLWTLASYGLQVVVPDELRGRLFALDAMVETLTLGVSSLVAGWSAGAIGIRATATALGVIAIVWAAGWAFLTRAVRRRTLMIGLQARVRPDAG